MIYLLVVTKEKMETTNLAGQENDFLKKLHQIVDNTVKEEKLITDNLSNPPKEILTRGQSISDKVARFGGSWKFIPASIKPFA